jgi:hypothetical protein
MDSFENGVDLPVLTVAVYPSFDHTDVIPKSFEMKVGETTNYSLRALEFK